MAAIPVQGKHAHPADSLHLLGFDCPACGLRQGVYAAGETRCRCSALLDVKPWAGYVPAPAFDLAKEAEANAIAKHAFELQEEGGR